MKPKSKIPTKTVSSNQCFITIGQVIEDGEIVDEGTKYYIHEDEWVEVMPVSTVKEVMQLSNLQQAGNDNFDLGGNLSGLCKEMSLRIIQWNWTNLMGEELEQPYNRPDVLERLSSDELLWLVNAASGVETSEERKKDSED